MDINVDILLNLTCKYTSENSTVNIIPHIRALLLRNQQVVIPGFGSFAMHQQPAKLNNLTGELSPPQQEIKFNRNQQDDDGVLADYLVKRSKISRASALETISRFAEESKKELDEKGMLLLEGLGKLILDRSGSFSFSLDEVLLQREKFAELPHLKVPARPQVVTPPILAPVTQAPPVSTTWPPFVQVTRRRRRWWIPAAILVVLVGLGTAGYLTGFLDTWLKDFRDKESGTQVAGNGDKLVFGKRADTVEADTLREQISQELDERTSRQKALAYDNVEEQPQPAVQQKVETPARVTAPPVTVFAKPYHIIGGAFLIEGNAVRLKESLEKKGATVQQFAHGNYHMLSLGSFDTRDEAKAAINRFREQFDQEFWVMRKE